jgi:hypothetical protein
MEAASFREILRNSSVVKSSINGLKMTFSSGNLTARPLDSA